MLKKKSIKERYALIQSKSVKEIHRAIRNSFTPAIAAEELNLSDGTALNSHLGKFILDGEVLSFAQFKALPVKRAENIWGIHYNRSMLAPVIHVDQYAGAHIYHIVCHSKTIREAASKLGIRDHALKRHLNKYLAEEKVLEFDDLKKCTEQQARQIFGSDYEATHPEQRHNLTPQIQMASGFTTKSRQNTEKKEIHEFDSLPEILPFSIFGTMANIFSYNKENQSNLLNNHP